MEYIKCSQCGSEEFIKIIAIPKKHGIAPKIEERKLICHKCKDELTAEEINEALGNA